MKHLLMAACALAALSACSKPAPEAAKPVAPAAAPAAPPALPTKAVPGTYKIDPSHSTVVFRLTHLGFSHYTAQFTKVDATLKFDPNAPTTMAVDATIDPKSLSLPTPPAGFKDELLGKDWLDAAKYPAITFKSTKVETTSPTTAKVTGDFTLHGVTKPLTLDVTFNGGYAPWGMDPGGRAGFSARGVLKRSDFRVSAGIPAPGSNLGVGDEVEVIIETEFSQDAPKPAEKPAA